MRITWIGHATVVLDIGGVRLLTDPLLRSRSGPLRRRGAVPPARLWADADAVLISHLHHDHLELSSLRMLPRIPVVTGVRNAEFLARRGLAAVGLAEGEWFSVGVSGVEVGLVRADHASRPMPHRPNEAHGHLVRTSGERAWIAGDTSLYPEMSGIPDQAGGRIDVAVVPVGGWGPRLSPGHLNSATAAQAAHAVHASVAVPYHWGTFRVPGTPDVPRSWMDLPGHSFPQAIERHAPGCRAVVLRPGESHSLDGR